MDSDSGLPDSPTEVEDSFTRRLQVQKGLRGQTPCRLNRALLEPGSTSAQLEAVEELARQAEGILARRLDRHQGNQHRDEEDGFEFTADFPRSPSMSSEQQVSYFSIGVGTGGGGGGGEGEGACPPPPHFFAS